MASQLPLFPRTIFTIVEPLSLIGGFLGPFINPDWFIASQLDNPDINSVPPSDDNARLAVYQLGNVYALLFLLGVVILHTTSELKVVRNYLICLGVADISHVGVTCWMLGSDRTMDVGSWNAVTWGNVGFTVFLCLTRTAYLLGLFGPDRQAVTAFKKKA
ncbi:uncharacterized protein GGS22DRAFT_166157 [Annulohypoxylon maeteangense]|uniref:uncharacterized protein n=1 Tax=Annulohypoxylon maeteangense TaxID=1927788 RepID=UPI00200796D7|nr:uncharacterized protein GGS22DRAFT_166157 [Annulohypoxylon maeteangense]KAI0883819.1 hypothetical protein GGS22DRAFT_166157 [Annulohypoxylon maeteangense]